MELVAEITVAEPDVALAVDAACSALAGAKVVRLRWDVGPTDLATTYDALVRAITARCSGREPHEWGSAPAEHWIEVVPRRAPVGERDGARPYHCDEPVRAEPRHLVLMYCEASATVGGANVFVDADDLVRALASDPDAPTGARDVPVTFERDGVVRRRPILAAIDGRTTVNWDPACARADDTESSQVIEWFTPFAERVGAAHGVEVPLALSLIHI